MKNTNNTILITGGTSGIGLGLALRLHEAGNKVIVAGRRTELLDEITARHEGGGSLVLDVTDPDSVEAALDITVREYPQLNVLINNAGIMLPEDLRDPACLAVAERTVATNLLGPIRMTATFLPLLAAQPHAAIVNVSSGLAFVPLPITPTYNATKAAVHSFTESLRIQLAGTSVQVVELVPPAVRTTLMGQQESPQAMPLDDFLAEALAILAAEPEVREILVDGVKFLRFAEARGSYAEVLAMLSGH